MEQLIFRETSGPLPTSEYDFVVDGEKVGFLQIRHKLSHAPDVPFQMASHIYYEIIEEKRGQGYGARLLALALPEAKKLGLKEIIVTCLEENGI
ncbi:MAG: GNAT family N-acetyltransferase [Candidatus Niyogibacteria bacterium]|nr:GNAT family N-acetyltransferase [Candidatus Niyogibacteria bacterium]